MTYTTRTLADAIPEEMMRVYKMLGYYKEIGPAGMLGASFIEQDLLEAGRAAISGDIVRMLKSYETLKGIKA